MPAVKCIGCDQLVREVNRDHPKFAPVLYTCEKFSYSCALSGLLKPSKGIEKAAADCPVDISKGCVVCGTGQDLTYYGEEPVAYICRTHEIAWAQWLSVPGKNRHEYIRPRRRLIGSRWIELFREFVQEAKK